VYVEQDGKMLVWDAFTTNKVCQFIVHIVQYAFAVYKTCSVTEHAEFYAVLKNVVIIAVCMHATDSGSYTFEDATVICSVIFPCRA